MPVSVLKEICKLLTNIILLYSEAFDRHMANFLHPLKVFSLTFNKVNLKDFIPKIYLNFKHVIETLRLTINC